METSETSTAMTTNTTQCLRNGAANKKDVQQWKQNSLSTGLMKEYSQLYMSSIKTSLIWMIIVISKIWLGILILGTYLYEENDPER